MILNDSEIIVQIGKGLVPSGLSQPANWHAKDSQVQPASLDLTVGRVFQPCTEDQNKQALPVGEAQYVLKPGRTAIVLTREELKMPDYLLAICFPPSKVSVRGILMTNPGQVDPGYEGQLRFTVINMGRKDFVLRAGDVIVSLIVMELKDASHTDWLTRHSGQKGGPVTWENLNRVSSDFVNVEARAREIAQKAVQDAELRVKILGVVLPVVATIASLVLSSMLGLFQPSWKDPLQKVQQDVAVLQSEKDVGQINKQIHDLQDQIRTLQQKMPYNASPSNH